MSSFGRKGRGRGRGVLNHEHNETRATDLLSPLREERNHDEYHLNTERMGRGRGRGNMAVQNGIDKVDVVSASKIQENKTPSSGQVETNSKLNEGAPNESALSTADMKGTNDHEFHSNSLDQDDEFTKAQELREEQTLQQLVDEMEEDMFETEEEREERLARKRREERAQKLQRLKCMEEKELDDMHSSNSSTTAPLIKRTKLENPKEESSMQQLDQYPMGSSENRYGDDPQGPLQHDEKTNDDGMDSFDMFTSSVTPPVKDSAMNGKEKVSVVATATTTGLGLDDAEGYYKASIGEIISFTKDDLQKMSFRVLGIIGKGVFSTVLKCVHLPTTASSSLLADATENTATNVERFVAMKLIRSNETMTKAAMKEVRILRLLQTIPKNERKKTNLGLHEHYIVRMIEGDELGFQSSVDDGSSSSDISPIGSMLEYHNHTAILFEYFPYNLRETLSKFGKNVGINLSAVRSYSKQLMSALKHLADHRVVHADIKLDNILVSENFSVVKLCDFGSAFFETDTDNVPTPYLVSRFYRAPEVILGLEYDRAIDLWSVAVSLVELFCGSVMFPGRNNNDMLKRFMDCIGPFSTKMIRRHIASFNKLGLVPHFQPVVEGANNFNFRRQEVDKVTGMPVVRHVGANISAITNKQIIQVLLKSRSASDSRGDVIKFADFLSKCLALDPLKRISLGTVMDHEFFKSKSNV